MQTREIKALAPEDVDRLRNAEGMGLALAAELNHYPGPKHVLELAERLHLSGSQTAQIRQIERQMRTAALRLGEEIITQERLLDRAFATRRIDDGELRRRTVEIGRLTGELRYTHLRAHLAVAAVLTRDQIRRYDELRGYAEAESPRGRRRS
jgi:Spy/CpxP family protein refolding chaperone